jgi:hypothetical protein
MALGYTIATILKRKSHIFDDDKVIVKTDWLEQLNRTYVQVRSASLMSLKTYILSLDSVAVYRLCVF